MPGGDHPPPIHTGRNDLINRDYKIIMVLGCLTAVLLLLIHFIDELTHLGLVLVPGILGLYFPVQMLSFVTSVVRVRGRAREGIQTLMFD